MAQLQLVIIPAIPLAIFALWFGYRAGTGGLEPMFVPLLWLTMPLLAIASVGVTALSASLFRGRLSDLRIGFLLAASSCVAVFVCSTFKEIGEWEWEQTVLRTRADELRRSLESANPAIEGLHITRVVRGEQGFFLYRSGGANPLSCAHGLFVPHDRDRTPRAQHPFSFSESSVRGVFYFHECN